MFLQRVKQLIHDKRITRNKLLVDLGLSKNSFVDWEHRGTIPSGEVISKLADYFHVSTDYLLGRTDIPTPFSAPADPSLQQLTENYLALNADGQAELLKHSILLIQSGLYIKHMDLPSRQA